VYKRQNSDDKENEMFYRRHWTDRQGIPHESIYRSTDNSKGESALDKDGNTIKQTDDALVYRSEYNDRNPLLLPALTWMKYHTKQLASYVAVDIAQGKFVLRSKVAGGQATVDAIKAKTEGKDVNDGSTLLENVGVDTTSFTIDKRAQNANAGARLTKLQVCSAVGIPEQYFGDLATGNLATAKTVELPMMKQFQSYQKVWADTYKDINEVVFDYNKIPVDKQYVDMDFPAIAPEDVLQAATAIAQILMAFPEFAESPDVKQIALMALGVNDPAEVLDGLGKAEESDPNIKLAKAVRAFRESINKKE